MSVIAQFESRRADLRARIADQLGTEQFAGLLRKATSRDHRRAETSTFEAALVQGTMTERPYVDQLVQLLPTYEALEAREAELADDPFVARFLSPGLHRVARIRADIVAFLGDEERPSLLPVSIEYAERVRKADPIEFVAHHYTRYLADLSGGFMIHAGLTKSFGDAERGLSYYSFPDIVDPMAFKVGYRDALNETGLDADDQLRMIEEVALAYEFNIEMVAELAVRYELEAATAQ